MAALFAFLHHLAAFTLVAALAVEFVLLKDQLTVVRARKIQVADLIFGVSAGVVLIVGLLRVFYFEKGATYYGHSVPFMAKFALFVLVGLLSIYPTVEFISWRTALKHGELPTPSEAKMRRVRMLIHSELAAVVGILLCAALMARGKGIV